MTDDRSFQVRLYGEHAATVVAQADGRWRWWFEEAWFGQESRPVLSLGVQAQTPGKARRAPDLPPFLSNLLPEPKSALRRRLARTHGLNEADEASLLALLGADMSGAVEVLPVDAAGDGPVAVDDDARRPLFGYRASLGGMQLKFSAEVSDRVTLPARGQLGRWILKLPPPHAPKLPAMECACLELARDLGFPVPEARVVAREQIFGLPDDLLDAVAEAFVIRRFDRRDDGSKVHMEELISVMGFHPGEKYPEDSRPGGGQRPTTHTFAGMGAVVHRFAKAEAAMQLLERVALDAVVGNGDAHLKNWAFVFPDRRTPQLAPAYDIVPTVLLGGGGPVDATLAMPLMGHEQYSGSRFSAVNPSNMRELAGKLGLDKDEVEGRTRGIVLTAEAALGDVATRFDLGAQLPAWREHASAVAGRWR